MVDDAASSASSPPGGPPRRASRRPYAVRSGRPRRRTPGVRGLDELGLVGDHRPAHLPPGPDPFEAGLRGPARPGARRPRRRHVDLLGLQPAAGAHGTRLALGPLDGSRSTCRRCRRGGRAGPRARRASGRPSGRGRCPTRGCRRPVAHHDVLAHEQAVLRDLDQHVIDARRGPATGLALVGAQQMGQARDMEPITGIGGPTVRPGGTRMSPSACSGRSRTSSRQGSRFLIMPHGRGGKRVLNSSRRACGRRPRRRARLG